MDPSWNEGIDEAGVRGMLALLRVPSDSFAARIQAAPWFPRWRSAADADARTPAEGDERVRVLLVFLARRRGPAGVEAVGLLEDIGQAMACAKAQAHLGAFGDCVPVELELLHNAPGHVDHGRVEPAGLFDEVVEGF